MTCDNKKVTFTSKVMTNLQLMDYMVSLHFIDLISWGILDNGPLYCITLWLYTQAATSDKGGNIAIIHFTRPWRLPSRRLLNTWMNPTYNSAYIYTACMAVL
jgi:hypothetical protein